MKHFNLASARDLSVLDTGLCLLPLHQAEEASTTLLNLGRSIGFVDLSPP